MKWYRMNLKEKMLQKKFDERLFDEWKYCQKCIIMKLFRKTRIDVLYCIKLENVQYLIIYIPFRKVLKFKIIRNFNLD